MSEPITTELRGVLKTAYDKAYIESNTYDKAIQLCGQIDAVDENLQDEVSDLAEYAATLRHDSVELPKDANGEFIHVDDCMRTIKPSFGKPFRVEQMLLGPDGWFIQSDDGEYAYSPDEVEHVRLGVRELLAEFACKVSHERVMTISSELLDKYAELIRRAGDGQ